MTEKSFSQHQGFDLAAFEGQGRPRNLQEYHVPETELYIDFKNRIAEAMNLPAHCIRFWVMQKRINDTIRPIKLIVDKDATLSTLASQVHFVALIFDKLTFLGNASLFPSSP